MWDLPGAGLEPVSPALAGGFLTTALPGKSLGFFFLFPKEPAVWGRRSGQIPNSTTKG